MLNYAAAPYTPASDIEIAVPGDPVPHVSPSRKKFLASRKSPPPSPPLELSPEIEAFIEACILQSQSETFEMIWNLTTAIYVKNKKEINIHQQWLEDIETAIIRMKKQIKVLSKRIDTGTEW